jgi:N-acetylated-alpha-linked acidic dipeptidase
MHLPASRRGGATALVAALTAAALALGVGGLGAGPASAAAHRITGFTPAHSDWEARYEKELLAQPTPDLARELTYGLTGEPGLVGTTGDYNRVRYAVNLLRSWGLSPQVHTYYTYTSIPRHISVDEVAPVRVHAANKERPRPWQNDFKDVVVGYNALSAPGNVTAPVVYVNYGTPDDFAQLAKLGVSVKGKIALIRYGGEYRGVKTHLAEEHGAVGVVLYSDPADDGAKRGKVYPDGPWRPGDGIQRGSVAYLWNYSGDPLTPGWPSTKNAPRIDPKKATELGHTPTVPISADSAKPILAHLGGPAVPKAWQGGLPFPYHLGAGPATLHLNLDIEYRTEPIWDVTVSVRGSAHPDQDVLVGAHRDAWVYGSDDNGSGAVNVLQLARSLGNLVKRGWRPDRTITLALWDGEEYGLYGSTEYAEDKASALDHTVAYLNMDEAGGRFFGPGADPTLDGVVKDTTKLVPWPEHRTLYGAWSAISRGKPSLERLGSGSDYTPFYQHFGVPSAELDASSPGGVYHCSCDDTFWMDHFGDPTWQYHVGITRETGLVALRLANADVPALDYSGYAAEVGRYLTDLGRQQGHAGQPGLRVDDAIRAAQEWQRTAASLNTHTAALLEQGGQGAAYERITSRLMADSRALLAPPGLPTRPWYRHQVFAPGINSGYATQTLPGIVDSVQAGKAKQAQAYVDLLAASLRQATAILRTAQAAHG